MTQPLVSIVIPCFNAADYVGEAIKSALDQTYPHVEVIVVDDGSTDDSLQVMKSFGDRIEWESGPNRGGCAARNRGLQLAKGELIQFLDADDLLHAEKLSRQVAAALIHPRCLIYCDYDWYPMDAPDRIEHNAFECGETDPVVFILETPRLSIQAPLHHRKWLVACGGFNEQLKGSQEIDLHLRLACQGHHFRHLAETLCSVRGLPGSVSSNYVRAVGEQLRVLPQQASLLIERGELTEERRCAFAGQLARLGRACLQRGRIDVGMRFLREADRLLPSAGIEMAYSPKMRPCVRLLGPSLTERLVLLKRRVMGQAIPH